MKKSKLLRSIRFSILLAAILGTAQAAPYGEEGRETFWTQPGGETLQLRVFGDEYYGRTETTEGRTVVFNSADKSYYHAALSADGGSLVPTDVAAHEPAPAGLAPHLDLPSKSVNAIRQANRTKYDGNRALRWQERINSLAGKARKADVKAAPFIGNKLGITILAQFPNDSATSQSDPVDFPISRAKMVEFCNAVGYTQDGNTGSVRDYFFDQSLGKLTYTQDVTQIITLPRARNYYNFSDYPTNKTLRGDAGRVLLLDAIQELKKQNFDFTNLSLDESKNAYATNIFFAGPDSGVWSEGLWPHQWSLAQRQNVGTVANPIYLKNYQITNIANTAPVIGTFCHESGHLILNYPDLYDYGGESEGVGRHCLMGGGNNSNRGKTPSPINLYYKEVAGWANITDISTAEFKTVQLQSTGNSGYRVRKPLVPTEYFVFENRGEGDKWAQYSSDKGVAIWHIDEKVSGNNNEQMTNEKHYQVSLEQADGRFDLEKGSNQGDTNDLFDLSTPLFTDTSMPDAKWWDGSASSIRADVLSQPGANMEVIFGIIPLNTILLNSPDGGEVIFPKSVFNITWKANIIGNVKIELIVGTEVQSTLAISEPNSGSFKWLVSSDLPRREDYKIRISSISNPVPASDVSVETFSLSKQSFPAGEGMPVGWFKPASAHTAWEVTTSESYEGRRSIGSKSLQDGKTAGIAYRSNFESGTMSFYMKVSTEDRYDFGRFFINGVEQELDSNGSSVLSGEVNWKFYSFKIPAGTHTFMWTYQKDDSYGDRDDRIWVDGVSMPPTTQEIAVLDPTNTDLVDGQFSMVLGAVSTGDSSKDHVFTIRNLGKAKLYGLKASMNGQDSTSFTVTPIGKKTLAPGKSTTFSVAFKPTKLGSLKANVIISSNDSNEGSFAIGVEGTGLGRPKITVGRPDGSGIKNDGKLQNFGLAAVNSNGKKKTFTVKNNGSTDLVLAGISASGRAGKDFTITLSGNSVLIPGESTYFNVTFKPSARGKRVAVIKIVSNDNKANPYKLNVFGTGAARKFKATPAAVAVSSFSEAVLGDLSAVKSTTRSTVELVDGVKYQSLTLHQPVDGVIEVSSDLLDWYSGPLHTTVLQDDANILKVRDNTPVGGGAKRHIRLKRLGK